MNIVTLLWWLIGIFGGVAIATGCIFIWYFRVYKYKFEIHEDRSGKGYERDRIVRGRLLTIGGSLNQKVFWIPKEKTYFTAYGRKMGKNMYWIFVGKDGWFYNFVAGDLDTKRGVLDIEPVDNDVRAFHTTNYKNIKERYDKPKNWPVVLMYVSIILAVSILAIGNYMGIKKQNEGLATVGSQIEVSKELNDQTLKIVSHLDKLINADSPGLIDAVTNNTGGT